MKVTNFIIGIKMKKLSVMLAMSLLSSVSFATDCTITTFSDDSLYAIINDSNGFVMENYNEVCLMLKNANAKVSLYYDSSISEQQTTAMVIATAMDKSLPIRGTSGDQSMRWSTERTTKKEKELLMSAVNDAISGLDQADIQSLNESRKRLGQKTYP